jgi:hypothetical protein
MDFERYPEWNPFIRRISGEPRSGERLTVRIEPPESRGMTFRPRVLPMPRGEELGWIGHLLVPGLFDGEHHLEVEALDAGRSRFTQREVFRGLLVPLTGRSLRNTEKGFEAMNRALKARAEGSP